jgi:hypothetical protein
MSPFALKLHQKEKETFSKYLFKNLRSLWAHSLQSPAPTPPRKISGPLKWGEKRGENTPSQNLGLAGLSHVEAHAECQVSDLHKILLAKDELKDISTNLDCA